MEVEEDTVAVSLCKNCAVHPDVKSVVSEDSVIGICGLCGDERTTVRNPENFNDLKMLIRALVCFYWDEDAYNPHWGGDGVPHILSQPDNPVLLPPASDEYRDDFYEAIEDDPYPDVDEGISVYAGFDEGVRLLHTAISKTPPRRLSVMRKRLQRENFFQVENDLDALLASFIDELEVNLPRTSLWYRARQGVAASFQRLDRGMSANRVWQPYAGDDISAPPPPIASLGRLNRQGVSVLYLASDSATAVAEIRPHPGHYVSVGGFRSMQDVRIANFDPHIRNYASNENRLHIYSIIHAFDRMMSTPVTPEKRNAYLLTQLLAEVLRNQGFDGVQYKSSVGNGVNVCIFHPEKFSFAEDSSSVVRVDRVLFETTAVESTVTPDDLDHPLELLD